MNHSQTRVSAQRLDIGYDNETIIAAIDLRLDRRGVAACKF